MMDASCVYKDKNKPSWSTIIAFNSITLILWGKGISDYYLYSSLNFLILTLIISVFLETCIIIREFVNRPCLVCIDDDQIILSYRFRSEKIIKISNIKVVYISEFWQDIPILRYLGNGGAVDSLEFPNGVLLNHDISTNIVKFYFKKFGRYPEIKMESSFQI